jgi:Na+-transporting NADH:ubiquinone oxidoreductase subunit NqrC
MSEENDKRKTWWEILILLIPLISGVIVTGAGLYLTYISNAQRREICR